MVAERVEVISHRAAADQAWRWSSDGKGAYDVSAVNPQAGEAAPTRGTRVICISWKTLKKYAERATVEPMNQGASGHVPVPIALVEKPGAEAAEVTDGAALWTKPKADIKPADYTDFYRSPRGWRSMSRR